MGLTLMTYIECKWRALAIRPSTRPNKVNCTLLAISIEYMFLALISCSLSTKSPMQTGGIELEEITQWCRKYIPSARKVFFVKNSATTFTRNENLIFTRLGNAIAFNTNFALTSHPCTVFEPQDMHRVGNYLGVRQFLLQPKNLLCLMFRTWRMSSDTFHVGIIVGWQSKNCGRGNKITSYIWIHMH